MPTYRLAPIWSDPIPVAKDDYVQNKGSFAVEICAIMPASSEDALLIQPGEALLIVNPTSIRARSAETMPATLTIIPGL